MNKGPLKLSARDAEDLEVIAAVLQDSIAPLCDMLYRPADKKFVMVVHRFRWDDVKEGDPCFERVHCALEVEGVEGVQQHGFSPGKDCGMLDLLTIMPEEGALKLVFAGEAQLRLKVGDWRLKIKDFGEPWPTSRQPLHPA